MPKNVDPADLKESPMTTTMIYTHHNNTFRVENPDKRAITRWINQLDRQNRYHIRFSNAAGTLSVQGGNFGKIRVGVQLNTPETESGRRVGRLLNPDYEGEAPSEVTVLSSTFSYWVPMRFNVSKEMAIEVAAHFSETGHLPEDCGWEWL